MTLISKSIEDLIQLNIKIWHEATKVKDIQNTLLSKIDLTAEERVDIAFNIRRLNAERSAKRWEIDSQLGTGTNETKTNVYTGE